MAADRHFIVIVAGENHEELIAKYGPDVKVEPYTVFEYSRAEEYRQNKITFYEKLLENDGISEDQRIYITECIKDWKEMDIMDFYLELTEGLELDEKTGNAISSENPDLKYVQCNVARKFAYPFILKDGSEVFSAKKGDIDWSKVHLADARAYEVAWDTVMEGKTPETDDEKAIYENMKERKYYFEIFGNRENYIKSNTAFWGYAFLSEETGWVELDNTIPQFEWVSDYYDRFIKPLPDKTLLTKYECLRD